MRLHAFLKGLVIIVILAGLTCCLGVNADIVVNQDNSGTLNLEYRINRAFDSLGRLDGNEGRPPLPVGRMDFERTVERIPGMKLVSYNSRDAERDRIVTVKLEFATIDDLMMFMDASGQNVQYLPGSNRMAFTLNSGNNGLAAASPDMNSLIGQIAQGYNVAISMSFPHEGTVNVVDTEGRALSAGAMIQSPGKKVSCSLPLERILSTESGIILQFQW